MNKLTVFFVFTVGIGAVLAISNRANLVSSPTMSGWQRKAALETPEKMAELASASVETLNWPPVLGEKFPDVTFFDHVGKEFSFSDLRGKPTLIEYVAMSCAGCQAFSGGKTYGAYGEFASQSDLGTVDEYFKRFTGQELETANINFVQVIVYDLELKSPTPGELAAWRKHFHLDRPGTFVISGGETLANQASFAMIPGFQLLDENLVIKIDSTGHNPRHNFYTELLLAAKKMLE